MRYFIIQYVQRANGQYDELSEIRKNLKPRHYSTSAVILDFKELRVLQAHVNGVNAGRDWEKIFQTYVPHYQKQFDMLLKHNHGADPNEAAPAEPAAESA